MNGHCHRRVYSDRKFIAFCVVTTGDLNLVPTVGRSGNYRVTVLGLFVLVGWRRTCLLSYLVKMCCCSILLVMALCSVFMCVCMVIFCVYVCVGLYIFMYMYGWWWDFPQPSMPARGQPASCTMNTGYFLGVKRPGLGVDHPPHLAPRLKKG